jgi:hypothetical protein
LLGAVVAACSVWLWACGVLISDVCVTRVTLKEVNKKEPSPDGPSRRLLYAAPN